MRLISWNTAGRTARLAEQAEVLAQAEPDLVALQEVRAAALPAWREALVAMGLVSCLDTALRLDGRYNTVLIAARGSLEERPAATIPQPERFLSARVQQDGLEFELHAAHLPPGVKYGLVKVQTFVGIYAVLARQSEVPRILCGDFNSPWDETPEGETRGWGLRHPMHAELWDAAELAVLRGLEQFDLADVYRTLNGWDGTEDTWVHAPSGRGRRFDHVFASAALNPVECSYVHDWREAGLSDHSAIFARFAPRSSA